MFSPSYEVRTGGLMVGKNRYQTKKRHNPGAGDRNYCYDDEEPFWDVNFSDEDDDQNQKGKDPNEDNDDDWYDKFLFE